MVKFRATYLKRSYQDAIYGITGANLACFRSKEISVAEDNFC